MSKELPNKAPLRDNDKYDYYDGDKETLSRKGDEFWSEETEWTPVRQHGTRTYHTNRYRRKKPTPAETRPENPTHIHQYKEDFDKDCDLKSEINDLLWIHGPDTLTLKEAEALSIHILLCIMHGEISLE